MDREDTCHRTCFSLQLDGNVLDNFAELKSIEGLQEGSLLKVVEGEIWTQLVLHLTTVNRVKLHDLSLLFLLQSPTQCARPASMFVTSETC